MQEVPAALVGDCSSDCVAGEAGAHTDAQPLAEVEYAQQSPHAGAGTLAAALADTSATPVSMARKNRRSAFGMVLGSCCRSPVPLYCGAVRNLAPAAASKLWTMSRLLSIVMLVLLLGGLASAPALNAGEGPVPSSQAAGYAGAPIMAAMDCGACAAMGACIACGPAPATGPATSWLPPALPPLHFSGQPRPPEAAPPRRFFI